MLRYEERLLRLTLAIAMFYVWLIFTGIRTILNGKRFLLDRRDCRNLFVFQIVLRFIDHQLV